MNKNTSSRYSNSFPNIFFIQFWSYINLICLTCISKTIFFYYKIIKFATKSLFIFIFLVIWTNVYCVECEPLSYELNQMIR